MGAVQERRRVQFTGLAADRTSISPDEGDAYFATDTNQFYIGFSGAWVHWPRYVPIVAPAIDFDETDFNHAGAWQANAFDFTGIVPVGTISVMLSMRSKSTTLNKKIGLRTNAGAGILAQADVRCQVAGVFTSFLMNLIPLDTDRLADSYSDLTGVDGGTRFAEVLTFGYWI